MLYILSICETIHLIKVFKGVRAVCSVLQLSERWPLKIWPVDRMKLASHFKQIWRDILVYPNLLVFLALSGKSPVFIDLIYIL